MRWQLAVLVLAAQLGLWACGGGPMAADLAAGGIDQPGAILPPDGALTPPDGAPPAPDGTDAGPPDGPLVTPACPACQAYEAPVVAGNVSSTLITEISGMAASVRHPGVFYVHNDSGDTARFFALDATARMVGEFALTTAIARDWEDIAVGPCDAGSCVYLGEIGDNLRDRGEYAVYRVAEPEARPAGAGADDPVPVSVRFERFPFVYPDGAHNAETLLVHPVTGDVYLVTREPEGAPSVVYRLAAPLQVEVTVTAERVADLDASKACGAPLTGGALNPCGDRLLLRSRAGLCELVQPPGQPFEALFAAAARPVPVAMEGQGEAVTYATDGRGYFTIHEGVYPALSQVTCQP